MVVSSGFAFYPYHKILLLMTLYSSRLFHNVIHINFLEIFCG